MRPDNWELAASVQQELAPSGFRVGRLLPALVRQLVYDGHRAVSASDFTAFYLTAPLDPRLPGGGGYQVGPLYRRRAVEVRTDGPLSRQFEQLREADGELERLRHQRHRAGEGSRAGRDQHGRKYADNCELRAVLPELGSDVPGLSAAPVPNIINRASPTSPLCHYEEPFLTRVSGLASYAIPKIEVQVGVTFQSNPGIPPVGRPGPTCRRSGWCRMRSPGRRSAAISLAAPPTSR